jgi:hypothetical protein
MPEKDIYWPSVYDVTSRQVRNMLEFGFKVTRGMVEFMTSQERMFEYADKSLYERCKLFEVKFAPTKIKKSFLLSIYQKNCMRIRK